MTQTQSKNGTSSLPDDKLAQDIVSAFFVFAGLSWHMGLAEDVAGDEKRDEDDEKTVLNDRHSRGLQDRYARESSRTR